MLFFPKDKRVDFIHKEITYPRVKYFVLSLPQHTEVYMHWRLKYFLVEWQTWESVVRTKNIKKEWYHVEYMRNSWLWCLGLTNFETKLFWDDTSTIKHFSPYNYMLFQRNPTFIKPGTIPLPYSLHRKNMTYM